MDFSHAVKALIVFGFSRRSFPKRKIMKLQINGEERIFDDSPTPLTLASLVDILGMKPDRVAVELNRDIVPRDRWSDTKLTEGDRLEVVHFVGGGL